MKSYTLTIFLLSFYTNLVLFFVIVEMFLNTKSAAKFWHSYAARSDLPMKGIISLSFAMQNCTLS